MTSKPTTAFLDRRTPPHIATLILLSGVASLNMSFFLPSLSRMADYFQADYGVMQLAVSGYLAVTAVLQIAIGPLSDKIGRRPVMLGALAIFVLATLGALMAQTVEVFLAFRMLQGVVVTGIVLPRAVVRDMVPAERSASMIGYVTMGMALVPMLGPVLGGMLEQAFDWHATFVVLAAVGIGAFALCWFDQGETLSGTGVGFADQLRSYPELFASPRFWGYSLSGGFAQGAFFAFLGGASFVAGDIFRLSAFWIGLALGAPAIGYIIGNFLSGRFSERVGIDRMVLAGIGVAGTGLSVSLILTVAGFTSPWTFFSFCTLLGLGNGMTLPNAMAGLLSVRPHLAGTASGLGGAIQIGAGAVMATIAVPMLSVESGPAPLLAIMVGSQVCAGCAIFYVMRRQRALAG